MPRGEDGQYELVLENRQVLGIFFLAALLSGVFFALGYIVGKSSSGSPSAGQQQSASTAPQGNPGEKASALPPAQTPPAAETAAAQPPAEKPGEPPAAQPAAAPALQPEAFITLQVAALSKKEDADAMVALLRSKQFQVSIANPPTDKLHHVQVGPFATMKEADETKKRLEAEGFKPIVKR
jgi:cell division septation protein DedD